jgi:hypothetical protein
MLPATLVHNITVMLHMHLHHRLRAAQLHAVHESAHMQVVLLYEQFFSGVKQTPVISPHAPAYWVLNTLTHSSQI